MRTNMGMRTHAHSCACVCVHIAMVVGAKGKKKSAAVAEEPDTPKDMSVLGYLDTIPVKSVVMWFNWALVGMLVMGILEVVTIITFGFVYNMTIEDMLLQFFKYYAYIIAYVSRDISKVMREGIEMAAGKA